MPAFLAGHPSSVSRGFALRVGHLGYQQENATVPLGKQQVISNAFPLSMACSLNSIIIVLDRL